MFGRDNLDGSLEFETTLNKLDNGRWEASAKGYKAIHVDMEQAINDLNQKIEDARSSGELLPDIMG